MCPERNRSQAEGRSTQTLAEASLYRIKPVSRRTYRVSQRYTAGPSMFTLPSERLQRAVLLLPDVLIEREAVSTIACPRMTLAGSDDVVVSEGTTFRVGLLLAEHRAELENVGWTVQLVDGQRHDLFMKSCPSSRQPAQPSAMTYGRTRRCPSLCCLATMLTSRRAGRRD